MDEGADIFERGLCLPSDIKMTPTSRIKSSRLSKAVLYNKNLGVRALSEAKANGSRFWTATIYGLRTSLKNNDYAMWLKVCKKADCYLFDEDLAKYSKAAEYLPSKVIGDFVEQLD